MHTRIGKNVKIEEDIYYYNVMEPYRIPKKRNTLLYAQAVQTDTISYYSKKNALVQFMQRNATSIKPVSPFCFLHNGRIRKMFSNEYQDKLPSIRQNRSTGTEESQLRIKIKEFKASVKPRRPPSIDTPTRIQNKAASYFIASPRRMHGAPYYDCIHRRNASALMRSMITGALDHYRPSPAQSISFNGSRIAGREKLLNPIHLKSSGSKKCHKLDAFLSRIFPKRNYCCFSNLLGKAQFSYLKY